MDEVQIIDRLGITESSTVFALLEKNIRSIIGCLNTLEKYGIIKIVEVHYIKGTKKLYMTNEIYRDYFN